jgi:hypothetical protein
MTLKVILYMIAYFHPATIAGKYSSIVGYCNFATFSYYNYNTVDFYSYNTNAPFEILA